MERMYSRLPWSQRCVEVMFAYQLYDFAAGFFIAELQTVDMFAHHIMAGSLAFFALYPYAHAYVLFYFGIVELSSVILTGAELVELFPKFDRDYPAVRATLQGAFAVSFIIIRLLMWPYMLFFFWSDNYVLVQTGGSFYRSKREPHGCFNPFYLYLFFIPSSLFLSCCFNGIAERMSRRHEGAFLKK